MSISVTKVVSFRKSRGWSQEKLAAMSGLSERTIQRVEKDGSGSLDTKMALATAFDVSPAELNEKDEKPVESGSAKIDWGGAVGLFLLGLAVPLIILLTGTNGIWELVSAGVVVGLTVILSITTHGARKTYQLFDKTSWLVKAPAHGRGLSHLIEHANAVIKNAYIVGLVATLVTALTISVHVPSMLETPQWFVAVSIKPLIYAVLFVEFWFRPFKGKLEKMLKLQVGDADTGRD